MHLVIAPLDKTCCQPFPSPNHPDNFPAELVKCSVESPSTGIHSTFFSWLEWNYGVCKECGRGKLLFSFHHIRNATSISFHCWCWFWTLWDSVCQVSPLSETYLIKDSCISFHLDNSMFFMAGFIVWMCCICLPIYFLKDIASSCWKLWQICHKYSHTSFWIDKNFQIIRVYIRQKGYWIIGYFAF